MKLLILGCSSVFTRRVIPALNNIKNIDKIDVASLSKDLKDMPEHQNIKVDKWYKTYEEAISKSDASIVYISLPNHMHFVWTKKALENNFHTIVEKPAVLSIQEMISIVEIAKKKNLCLAESLVWGYHPQILNILDDLHNNLSSTHVLANFQIPKLDAHNFRTKKIFGGGAFNDMSSYAISIGRIIFNKYAEKMSIDLDSNESNLDTSFAFNAEYGNGNLVKGNFGFGFEYKNEIRIQNEFLEIEFQRVFSPPNDIELEVRLKDRMEEKSLFFMGDVYLEFFNLVLESINNNSYSKWAKLLEKDLHEVNKLRKEFN